MFLITLGFSCLLAGALVIIYSMTNYITYTDLGEKFSAFECGFDPLSKMRAPFSTRFFLLVVLFLIFDIEIALLFPVISILYFQVSSVLFLSVNLFLIILLVGMFHEWNEGALDWISS